MRPSASEPIGPAKPDAGRDRDEARDRAGDEAKQRRLALHRPFHQQPGQRGAGGGHHRVDEGQRRRAVGFQIRAGVEAEPANPQQRGADHRHGERVRRKRFLAIADALADHQRADETGDAGVDMHHRAAGEVERASSAGEPADGTRRPRRSCPAPASWPPRRSRPPARCAACDVIGAATIPDPMGDREIDHGHPGRMKTSTAENFMRSAKAPTIRAGVIIANVIWNTK